MSSIQGSKRVTVSSADITDDDGLLVKTTQIATLPIGIDDSSKLFKGSDIVGYATTNFLQDGELADINGIKTFLSDTNQVKPSEGAFVNGDKTKLDNIEANANNFSIGAGDITNTMLAAGVQTSISESGSGKLITSGAAHNVFELLLDKNINFGGVSLKLTQSDLTPAFDLVHATNYPATALTGTISNSQLASDVLTASSSNTLTNKTFDCNGTGNSITNIENADIKSGAAIDVAKINFNSDIDIKGSSGTHGSCRLISSTFNLHMASESGYVLELDTNRNNPTSPDTGLTLLAPETSSYGTSSLKEVFKISRNNGDNDDWIGKINDSIVITESKLETKTSQAITDKCFIANQNSLANFASTDGVSLSAYGNLFNGKSDHDLAHLQIHDGDNNSHSLILTAGGSKFGDQSSGTNSEIHNVQAYYTKKGSSPSVGQARPLTIQRLGGSVEFGNPNLAPSAKIDEDSTCTKFKINCDDNTITNIQSSTVSNGDTLSQTLSTLSNRITTLEQAPKILAVCIYNGAAANPSYTFNNGFDSTASNIRQGTGDYKFTLASAATGNYAVFTTVIESDTGRDDIICQVDSNTAPTTSRFFITLHEGDNSTNPGTLVDRSICVMVCQ